MINIPLMNDNITNDDINVLIDFLKNNNIFTQNKYVMEFEKQWGKWLGMKYSVFVNSGSSANYITMSIIAELYGRGEIIVPTITWSSDIASVFLAGHQPVFVDVDKKNFAMKEEEIINSITKKTKAVFLTHALGFNGLSEQLLDELDKRGILLIEDVCESHGAMCGEKKCGSLGLISNFSFYYAHHMSTIEGGMICTNDRKVYEYARMFRSHGMVRECTDVSIKREFHQKYKDLNPEFIFSVPGFNMRSTEINAVIGLNQLKRLNYNNKIRYENFKFFLQKLNQDKFYTDFDLEGSVNYAFILLLREPNRKFFDKICKKLNDEKVEFRRGTSGGGNQTRQPYIQNRMSGIYPEKYVNADFIHFYGMYIGNFPTLSKEKIEKLTNVLNRI